MSWILVLLVLPFIIGMMGEVVKKLALPGTMPEGGWVGWRGVYFVTYKLHALCVGAVFGIGLFLFHIPWPKDVFGDSVGGAMLAGALSGGVAMVSYAAIVGVWKNSVKLVAARLGAASGARESDPGAP